MEGLQCKAKRLEVEAGDEFFDVDDDVVLADLIEGVFQVVLDIVEADEDYAEEDRQDIGQGRERKFGLCRRSRGHRGWVAGR